MTESSEFVKIVYHDHFRRDSLHRRGNAATKCREQDFLGCAWSHAGELHQRARLLTAHPMRYDYLLKLHVESKLAHFTSNILRGKAGLRRPRRSLSNVVGKMRELLPSVIACRRGLTQLLEFSRKLRRSWMPRLEIALS